VGIIQSRTSNRSPCAVGEFRAALRGHDLSAGTMRHKLVEFLDLHQGNHSVYEYIQEFNNLA
jgi:hypothetical protein